jgi:predicted outer membrane repeat protein
MKRFAIFFGLTGIVGVAHAGTLTVTTTGDGVAGSLRTAIQNAVSGDTIVFQIPTTDPAYDANTGYYTITLSGATAANKTLVIDKNLTIDGGNGRPIVVRRANNAPTDFRIFNVKSGVSATLSRIWISNGNLTSATASPGDPSWFKDGAGIQNFGVLTLRDCILTGNATGGVGGALLALSTTTLARTTFSGNTAASGGAIYTGGVFFVTIDTCTFTANNATEGGAMFNNHGVYTLKSCTVFGNTATGGAGTQGGGGIVSIGTNSMGNNGSTHFENTIVAGNSAPLGPDVSGTAFSDGYNLIGSADNNSGFTATGDRVGVTTGQVNLKPLDYYGGFIPTMPPKPGSFAIDKGKQTTDANGQPSTTDQRGQPRPIDRNESNAPGGDGTDNGAVEVGAPQTGPTFTVNTTAERDDGECTTYDCTLIDALNVANAVADANTINFAPQVAGIISTNNITPTGLAVTNPVTINGPGPNVLTLSASSLGRIFRVTSANVSISGMHLAFGQMTNADGGAIHNSGGLTLTNCTIDASNAAGSGNGGGVYNASGATLSMTGCTLKGDMAGQFGGGVYSDGTLTATNCTFSANMAFRGGGLITRFNGGNSLTTLRNCTITLNTASSTSGGTADGGGGYYAEGGAQQVHVANTIIAGNSNSVNPDVRGNFTSDGHNFIGSIANAVGFSNNVNGDQVGTPGAVKNPQLDALASNGGLTQTHALLSGSTAIDAGDNNLAPPTDQRGFPRIGASDIGAFEFGSSLPSPTPTPTPTATPTAPPGLVGNVSTRLPVGTGDNVLIEGFIVQGPNGSTKKIMVRAIGPSLLPFGIQDALVNPTLEIRDASNTVIASNNDWQSTQVGGIITSDQSAEINASGVAPVNDAESAIIADLAPGSYTAVVRGVGDTVGTGVVDAYDLSAASPARLANIATRGLIQPGDKLMIAGFIIQNAGVRAVILAVGPSLSAFGITNALPDTTLQLRDQNGGIVREDDDWQSDQQAEIEATGLQPSDPREAAMVVNIAPGQYTAQVRGKPEATGIGVVEVFFLQ